jgi:hypothetical protein
VCVCVCARVCGGKALHRCVDGAAGREGGQYVQNEIITPISPRYEVEEEIQGERLSNRAVKRL